jgi:hypothetical protein
LVETKIKEKGKKTNEILIYPSAKKRGAKDVLSATVGEFSTNLPWPF